MNTAALSYPQLPTAPAASSQTLLWAVAISIILHLSAMLFLPSLKSDATDPLPEVLNIQIEAPKAPEPIETPVAEPEPEPPKPIVKSKPKPEPKPVPIQKSAPIQTTEPQATPPEAAEESVSAPVMSVAPVVEATPVFTAPPPPPPPPPGPSQADLDAARRGYAERLARAIAEHKRYPRVAQMRGWQGEVLVNLKLDGNGNLLESNIELPSGYEILDKTALEMIAKAIPLEAPPDILKSSVFNIQVPVSFKLE